jgi:hypothetical protein
MPELVVHALDQLVALRPSADVAGETCGAHTGLPRDHLCLGRTALAVATCQHDVGAATGQAPGDRPAKSPRATCHERNLAVEAESVGSQQSRSPIKCGPGRLATNSRRALRLAWVAPRSGHADRRQMPALAAPATYVDDASVRLADGIRQ